MGEDENRRSVDISAWKQLKLAFPRKSKLPMAERRLFCHHYVMAVFILEDALSVKADNASMAVFVLRTHYSSGLTWANICSSSGYASAVSIIKTGTRRIMRLDELSF